MGSEGLSGLLTEAGVRGITIRISAERTTHYACAKFADDYAGFVRAQHLHAVFDCIDVFCCASGNDTNKDKTLGTPLAADDMVREAQTRIAFHIGLDWRCATQPDSFADDIQSVRPPTRQAFFERWGCVCRVNSGNYTLDRCIEPD